MENRLHLVTHRAKRTKKGVGAHGAKPIQRAARHEKTRHTSTARHWRSIQRALLFGTANTKGGAR